MSRYIVMVDMDQTLIESVLEDDPRYAKCKGQELFFSDEVSMRNGVKSLIPMKIKVNIRPFACHMIASLKSSGHAYVLWSAGTYNYVHAVINYFSKICGVSPDKILTRNDLVTVPGVEPSVMGNKFKSMTSLGFPHDDVLIIEDNKKLVAPGERDRVIEVLPWSFENTNDRELSWVSQLLELYGRCRITFSRAAGGNAMQETTGKTINGQNYRLIPSLGRYDLVPDGVRRPLVSSYNMVPV